MTRAAQMTTCSTEWPFWQSEDCPAWCEAVHCHDDRYDDRRHLLFQRVEPIALSLHETREKPVRSEPDLAGDKERSVLYGPGYIDVAGCWHYRHADPEVLLTVPNFDAQGNPYGDRELRLTIPEALAFREALTGVVTTLQATRSDGLEFHMGPVSVPMVTPSIVAPHRPSSEGVAR